MKNLTDVSNYDKNSLIGKRLSVKYYNKDSFEIFSGEVESLNGLYVVLRNGNGVSKTCVFVGGDSGIFSIEKNGKEIYKNPLMKDRLFGYIPQRDLIDAGVFDESLFK